MAESTRYFQLTPDILVEYNYYGLSNIQEQEGDVEHIVDFDDNAYTVYNSYCSTRTFLWTDYSDHFVTPVNMAESKFVQCTNGYNAIWNGADLNIQRSEKPIFQTENNNDGGDLLCDNFRLHFTSRNYLGNSSYDGFILSVHIYDRVKNKIFLMSQYIKKTDTLNINENPVIINQRLYTMHMDFTIPNVYAILNADADWIDQSLNGSEKTFRTALSPKYELMDNTPVVMNIYGVKSTTVKNNYEYYTAEKLNAIYIPIVDKTNGLSIVIKEAEQGDYF